LPIGSGFFCPANELQCDRLLTVIITSKAVTFCFLLS
jgi:hypothetical protein